jgi:hypothetical protein
MMFAPRTQRRPPFSMPGTGSVRHSMPGRKRPTEPGWLNIGVFIVNAGAVSVAP